MVRSGALVSRIAEISGLDEKTVTVHHRWLAEAGHIAKGKRGMGGQQMSHADCWALMLSVALSESPARGTRAVPEFNAMKCHHNTADGLARARADEPLGQYAPRLLANMAKRPAWVPTAGILSFWVERAVVHFEFAEPGGGAVSFSSREDGLTIPLAELRRIAEMDFEDLAELARFIEGAHD